MRQFAVVWVVLLSVALLAGGGTVVVDRTVEEGVVVLVEDDGRTVDQRVLPPGVLPASGRHEGAVLWRVDGGYAHDASATWRRRARAARRFDELSEPLSALPCEAGESVAREGRSESGLPHVRTGRVPHAMRGKGFEPLDLYRSGS